MALPALMRRRSPVCAFRCSDQLDSSSFSAEVPRDRTRLTPRASGPGAGSSNAHGAFPRCDTAGPTALDSSGVSARGGRGRVGGAPPTPCRARATLAPRQRHATMAAALRAPHACSRPPHPNRQIRTLTAMSGAVVALILRGLPAAYKTASPHPARCERPAARALKGAALPAWRRRPSARCYTGRSVCAWCAIPSASIRCPPPSPLPPVLTGHVSSLPPY